MDGAKVEGLENADAAKRGPIVFLTVPFRAQSETLNNLREALTDPGALAKVRVARTWLRGRSLSG